MAKKYHPDTNKDAMSKERFVEIQSAYDILSDDQKRAQYDRFGHTSDQPGFDPGQAGGSPFSGFRQSAGGFGGFNSTNAEEIFETLFGLGGNGKARASSASMRGNDIEQVMRITFLEACKGAKKTININRIINCGTCTGSGLKPGVKKHTCSACNGTGTRTFMVQSGFQMSSTCHICQGEGETAPSGSACGTCNGAGKVKERKAVEIGIPAG